MGKYRGLDKDEGWIKRRFAKIEKQMREDRAAKRLAASTIGSGGVTIKDGGYLASQYANGDVGLYAGPVNSTPSHPAGDGFALNVYTEALLNQLVFQAARLPPSVTYPTGYSALFASAQQVDLSSEDLTNGLHVDNGQAYLFSDDQVHLYATNGVTVQFTDTGSAANMFIDGAGRVWRSTSSLRNKTDIADVEVDPAAVLQMRGVTFRDKDGQADTTHVGFIAEELHELGLGQFVVYDTDGDPEAISYDRLTVALLAVLKDQEKRISALEADDA